MFEPLRELLPEDPQALIDDARVLGEKAGRLHGSRSADLYAALGGAVYRPLRCANDGVASWGQTTRRDTIAHESRATLQQHSGNEEEMIAGEQKRGALASSAAATERGAAWLTKALDWIEEDDRSTQAADAARRHRSRVASQGNRSSEYGSSGLLSRALHAAPHVLPRLLHRALARVTVVLPSVRSLLPGAVPALPLRRLLAHRSRRGGPEAVTAVTFHPLHMWIAVSVDEGASRGSTRVVVYDVSAEQVLCVLSHAFQRAVSWLGWKPFATDVLAVGCHGGVLVWSLNGGLGGKTMQPRALFYRTSIGFSLTSAAFSQRDGSLLACAASSDTRLHLLNLRQPPFAAQATAAVLVPSVDGGVQSVFFDDDDRCLICAVCEHPSLALLHSAGSTAVAGTGAHQTRVVPTPAPVDAIIRASGLGRSLYFMTTKGLEGALLTRITPAVGVEVLSMISTGLYRGVGGRVTSLACSRRRLWLHTETNHLLVCRYGQSSTGDVTLLPVGVAVLEAVTLENFGGCTTGSLLAAVELDGTVSFLPSYHS